MDPISAIGLAAAIAQFIELGVKVSRRMSDFSGAIDDVPQAFKQIKTMLPLVIDGLRKIEKKVATGAIARETQDLLLPVVGHCLDMTKELSALIDKALPSSNASSWDRTIKAIGSLRYDKKIEQIANSLNECMGNLTFHQAMGFQNLKVESDLSPPWKPLWLVPFDRNALFVDRGQIFNAIEETLAVQEGTQPKAALYGLGGIGKSQIALEFCYRKRRQDPQCSVFWVNAATVARFEESFARIANECGLGSLKETGVNGAALLKDWLEVHHEDPWLMVVDNVDERDVFFRETMRIGKTPSECIPQSPKGSLLFTTRSRDVAVDVANPKEPLIITEMDKEEGLTLAKGRLPKDTPEPLILELLETLEYIPLAITQAVAFMVKRRKSVVQYLAQYRKSDETRTKLLSYEFSDHGRHGKSMESVAKTWMLSFEHIRESSPRAAELLCLMAFFQHQGIPATLLQNEGEDEFDFQDAVAVLKAFSFVEANEADSVFTTHRLVQLATRWWLEKLVPSETDKWANVALVYVVSRFPEGLTDHEVEYFTKGETLLPHAEVILQYELQAPSTDRGIATAKLLRSSGSYLYWAGNIDQARERCQQAREIQVLYLGEKHMETIVTTSLLTGILMTINEEIEALPMIERLVEVQKEVLGEDHPDTISDLSKLGTAILKTGDLERSEALQREALERSERVLGRRHLSTRYCMSGLASLLSQKGQGAEASRLRREVYETQKQGLGAAHPSVLLTEGALTATLAGDAENDGEVLELLERNIRNMKDVFGPDHRVRLASVWRMMDILERNNRFEESLRLGQSTLAEASDALNKNTRWSSGLLSNISDRTRRLEDGITKR